MSLTRTGRSLRLAAALVVACLSLLVFASAHGDVATASVSPSDVSTGCAPETATCSQQSSPFSVTAGPVTNVGLNQAVYIDVTGVPLGDDLEVAYCSLAGTGTEVVAQPQCAAEVPGQGGGAATPEPEQYEYGTVTSNQTILAISSRVRPRYPRCRCDRVADGLPGRRVGFTGLRGVHVRFDGHFLL